MKILRSSHSHRTNSLVFISPFNLAHTVVLATLHSLLADTTGRAPFSAYIGAISRISWEEEERE